MFYGKIVSIRTSTVVFRVCTINAQRYTFPGGSISLLSKRVGVYHGNIPYTVKPLKTDIL